MSFDLLPPPWEIVNILSLEGSKVCARRSARATHFQSVSHICPSQERPRAREKKYRVQIFNLLIKVLICILKADAVATQIETMAEDDRTRGRLTEN